jgi:prophage regulatory protein
MAYQSNFDDLPVSGYIRQAQLIPNVLPFSAATLWRKVKAGTFPAPVKLSDRVTAWEIVAVRNWMQTRNVRSAK